LQTPRCVTVRGFSVHANCSIGARDRLRLERFIRYVSRNKGGAGLGRSDSKVIVKLYRAWQNLPRGILQSTIRYVEALCRLPNQLGEFGHLTPYRFASIQRYEVLID
jgi:hypothetical protein